MELWTGAEPPSSDPNGGPPRGKDHGLGPPATPPLLWGGRILPGRIPPKDPEIDITF